MSASDDTVERIEPPLVSLEPELVLESGLGDLERAEATALFDVREFARTARGTHRGELDLAPFEGERLPAEAARLLGILRDLERSTMQRMRNLLVTATHKDARVTAFLTTWAYERFWLADAFDAVLEASASEPPPEAGPARHDRRERADRRGPVRRAFLSNFAGADIVGVHVTSGLVDEWVIRAAYRRLAAIAERLAAVVDLALEVKDRHLAFLHEDALRRLADSARVQRLARRELAHQAWPIGSVDRPDSERSFFERVVFGSPEGRREARGIRDLIAGLPGLGSVASTVEARLAR